MARCPPAGRSPSPCGPKPPSGDGSVGGGLKALGHRVATRPCILGPVIDGFEWL
jgi:hypothetical protein